MNMYKKILDLWYNYPARTLRQAQGERKKYNPFVVSLSNHANNILKINFARASLLFFVVIPACADVTQLETWVGQKSNLYTQRSFTSTDIKNSAPQSAPATAQVVGLYQQQDQQITTDHTLNATRPTILSNDKLWDSLVNYYKGRVASDPQLSQMIASGQSIVDGAFGTGQMTFATSKPEQIMQLAAAYAMPYYLSMAQKEMVNGQLQIIS